MKKIFILMIFVLTIFGVSACNSNPSEVEISYDEQIAMPTNLSITGKVLSWTAVDNAKGYFVYADGEEVDKVRSNSFDFSKLTGDRIIFTVVTQAPRGMQDSAQSVSIAYVANKEQEVSSMKLAVANSGFGFNEDFAEELVNKGMLTSEFNAMMDGMEDFSDAMDEVEDLQDLFDAIEEMIQHMDNTEAMISALIKHMLPVYLQDQIEYAEYEITNYENAILTDPWNSFYFQQQINELQRQIAMYEGLLDTVEDASDEAIKSFVFVIDYFLKIEEMISEDLITNLSNFENVDGLADLNVNELVLIKEEMVDILQETMPSATDVILVIETMYSMSAAIEEYSDVSMPTNMSSEKTAGTILMSLEAFILFLDNFDEAFFQSIKDLGQDDLSEYMLSAEVSILTINYFADFKEENQELLDAINEVYSDEDKEAMIEEYKQSLIELYEDQGFNAGDIDLSFYTFDNLMALQVIMEDVIDNSLAAFVEADGEVLRAAARLSELNEEYYGRYSVDFEGEYLTTIATMNLVNEVVNMLNAVVSEMDIEDYNLVLEFYLGMAQFSIGPMTGPVGSSAPDVSEIFVAIETFITNSSTEQLALIQNFLEFADAGAIFAGFATDYETTFDEDYQTAHYNNDDFAFIFFANQYLDFMNSTNRQLIDDLLVDLAALIESEELADIFVIDDIDEKIGDVLDYLDANLGSIRNYDASNLTADQYERIAEIQDEVTHLLEE